jgi:hypothetical protein
MAVTTAIFWTTLPPRPKTAPAPQQYSDHYHHPMTKAPPTHLQNHDVHFKTTNTISTTRPQAKATDHHQQWQHQNSTGTTTKTTRPPQAPSYYFHQNHHNHHQATTTTNN